jgi:beta-fructofuranosidase
MKNYSPRGNFLWDPWFIREKGVWHTFFLQVKKRNLLADPESRHHQKITMGHAISKDLQNWQTQPIALKPGEQGEWDDFTLWTGTTIKKQDRFYMFYTGRSNKKQLSNIQRIGLATSDDLAHWKKHPDNPILYPDSRYYQTESRVNAIGNPGAWRDPFIFQDPKTNKDYMILSARAKGSKIEYNACIAIAESGEYFLKWNVLPPLLSPGIYDEMENPQLIFHDNKYYLFFSIPLKKDIHPKRKQEAGLHPGLHCYYSENLLGEYLPVNGNGVVIERIEGISSIQIIHNKGEDYLAIGWLGNEEEAQGKISTPFSLRIKGDKVYRA